MKNTELAYIAGIIDGDGSIGVNRWKGGYRIAIQVCMRNPKVPVWLKQTIGGCLVETSKDNKPLYKWVVGGEQGKKLCQSILPYLVEKIMQAKVITHFPVNKVGQKFSEEENILRETLWSIVSGENKCHKKVKE